MLSCAALLPLEFYGRRSDPANAMWASRDAREPGKRWVVIAAEEWSRERFATDSKTVGAELVDAFLEVVAIRSRSSLTVSAYR